MVGGIRFSGDILRSCYKGCRSNHGSLLFNPRSNLCSGPSRFLSLRPNLSRLVSSTMVKILQGPRFMYRLFLRPHFRKVTLFTIHGRLGVPPTSQGWCWSPYTGTVSGTRVDSPVSVKTGDGSSRGVCEQMSSSPTSPVGRGQRKFFQGTLECCTHSSVIFRSSGAKRRTDAVVPSGSR